MTITGEENPGVKATEALFEEFLTTCSSSESGAAALDSIAEFEQMVSLRHLLCLTLEHLMVLQ